MSDYTRWRQFLPDEPIRIRVRI